MSWLYERYSMNGVGGPIHVCRILGRWTIRFNRAVQMNGYTNAMWAYALKRVGGPIDNVLLLGLGGGGAVRAIYTHNPNCHIYTVEYDPAMIEVARRIRLWAPYSEPHILQADAGDALALDTHRYDLILVDLFDQYGISPLVKRPDFVRLLQTRLSDNGSVLVNFASFIDGGGALSDMFAEVSIFKYKANTLGLFGNRKI